ncbi:serine/threonine-protein kinase haspin [Sander lucioperca]|uniref:serine/threonine-protein kinase haspin n=1 Tax=Sander lucioperca TaxID=283035 RepID=UPI00125DCECD|nr:serine/threonine-protein kinase haspin [Sander lucioperca]XP_035855833.1 serine/threonine-protein kinase haspin [Sander lucioperca]
MKPLKPLFLKTYGKERRKLSAWISPENRKQAFDSTPSTDGDMSVFEPAKPPMIRERKTSVASRRAGRPAKKKAMLCLAEKSSSSDEETPPPPSCPRPAQQSKTTRERRTGVARRRAGHPAKKKAILCLTDTSIDEENISPFCPQPAQQSKTSSDHLPSAGRFVTRRRHAAATKPQLPKSTFSMLDSSDDFTSGSLASRRILRARRVPPTYVISSAENSMNAAGTAGFASNPFQEISLNELTDHSLGPCPRKPIFCSTPSAGSFSKRPRLKPLSINDQSSNPPSVSVSCIGVLSTFQEDVDSPGQRVSAPRFAPPNSGEKLQSSLGEQEPDLHHNEEPSGVLEPRSTNKRRSCSVEAKSYSEDTKTKNAGELQSLNLLSTDDSESRSHFVSAAGGSGWLIEALKEKCLTKHCSVQLGRLDSITVSQLCSQTTYSSCLGYSSSAHSRQTSEHPVSVDSRQTFDLLHSLGSSFDLNLSVTNVKTSDYIQSVNSFESSEHAASVTGSQSVNNSLSAEHSSTQESMAQPESLLYAESTYHKDSRVEFIMGTQLPANSSVQTPFAVALKDKSLTKKCTVQLKKMSLSPQNSDPNKSDNDHTHIIEDPENLTSHSPVAQTQSKDPETEEKAALLTTTLKEKCITYKVIVGVKRVTLSQVKEILQLKDTTCDNQTKTNHQCERSTYPCNEETSAMKVNMKKRGSTSSKDKIASDKEEVVKNSSNTSQKGKKTYLAPKEKKRKSASTDRPGTTRKACISGLSVSRWKNKGSASTQVFRSRTAQTGGNKAVDCSIDELISTQHKPQPRELLGTTINFSTPVKASRLNLSSLLADFTPNTHTWSRLKAALSVHRKGMVICTPSSLRLSVSGSPRRVKLDISQDLFATPSRTPLPKHLRSQLLSRNSTIVCEDADLSDAEKVYAECGQQRPLPWEECILPRRMKQCVKIGEGTFGEVFSTTNASGDTVALKIIPVEGSEKVNGEDQKTLGEILHEIIISKELSSLKEKLQNKTHGFIGLNDLHCVQGCYPPDFLNAWDAFDQQRGSENDRPDFFEKDQLFIILEFEFGGMDLENSNGTLASLGVAKSILHQVTAALAVAEQELHFEHRDLHWGNVLVKTTKQKTGSFLLNGAAHSLETKGVLVRIIDYSLSRLEIDDLTVSCDISEDEELFMGQGDYQFDIYRQMRQENGNNWCTYHPHTNVLWLHYLCSKLLSMKYRGSGGRGAKGMREELTHFHGNILQYSSATEALQNCPMFH